MTERDAKRAELDALESAKRSLTDSLRAFPKEPKEPYVLTEVKLSEIKAEYQKQAKELEVLEKATADIKSRLAVYKKDRKLDE